MAARLGLVLYWTGCVLGGLILAAGTVLATMSTNSTDASVAIIATSIIAALVWLVGRGARFVLAGN